MTKSKPYSKSLVKRGLLVNISLLLLCHTLGCSSSTSPTYLKENIPQAIQNISKKEYNIDGLRVKLVGETIWIYMPVEDIFKKADQPEKYFEKFDIEQNNSEFEDSTLNINYAIKPIPESEKMQEFKYNKEVAEKMNDVLSVTRRVLFSTERVKTVEPKFISFVTADIKNGIEVREICYYLDLKKVSYNFISLNEYQHRIIQEAVFSPEVIGDKYGTYLDYSDITMQDFISRQIQHRIKLKFQKPEVDKNADIDKEIIKIIAYTIKIYGIKDFKEVKINNLLTNKTTSLNEAAIWARSTD